MATLERRLSRGSSVGDDVDEVLDPRIHVELEKLNKASNDINTSELELDEARSAFRQTLTDTTQKLQVLSKKLGSCIEKARPYYEARKVAMELQQETQKVALKYERAISMQNAAREMVDLAEQGYQAKGQPFDMAWQEMLNHATIKVNEAETERLACEQEHQGTTLSFNEAEQRVKELHRYLRRAINKSRPYFEMKAQFNAFMEEQKQKVTRLEVKVQESKALYSDTLAHLETISDEIHMQRKESLLRRKLGPRGAGVGAESPSPPPESSPQSTADSTDSLRSLSPRDVPEKAISNTPAVRPNSFQMELSAKSLVDSEAARCLSRISPVLSNPTSPVQDFVMRTTSVFRRPKSAAVSTIDKTIHSPSGRRSVPADFLLTCELSTLEEDQSLQTSDEAVPCRETKRLAYHKAVSLEDALDNLHKSSDFCQLPNTFTARTPVRCISVPNDTLSNSTESKLQHRSLAEQSDLSDRNSDYARLPNTCSTAGHKSDVTLRSGSRGSRSSQRSGVALSDVVVTDRGDRRPVCDEVRINSVGSGNASSDTGVREITYDLLNTDQSADDLSSLSDNESVCSNNVLDDVAIENLMLGDFESELEAALEEQWTDDEGSKVTLREYRRLPDRLSYLEPYYDQLKSPGVQEELVNSDDELTCF